MKLTNALDAKCGPILKKLDFASGTFILAVFYYDNLRAAAKTGTILKASQTILKYIFDQKETHNRTLEVLHMKVGDEWQLHVEGFFKDTFSWTNVKYGKLNDKLYASLPEGGRKLRG